MSLENELRALREKATYNGSLYNLEYAIGNGECIEYLREIVDNPDKDPYYMAYKY